MNNLGSIVVKIMQKGKAQKIVLVPMPRQENLKLVFCFSDFCQNIYFLNIDVHFFQNKILILLEVF